MMTVVNAGSLFPEKPLIKGYAYFKTTNLQECLYLGTYIYEFFSYFESAY